MSHEAANRRSEEAGPCATAVSAAALGRRSPSSDTLDAVWQALAAVTDPEIPVLSVVEMGIIADIRTTEGGVAIDVTPTFAACPATELICRNIGEAAAAACGGEVGVNVVFDPPWTSDRISEAGRQKLLAFGLAPPRRGVDVVSLGLPARAGAAGASSTAGTEALLENVPCPFCQSADTALESPFGPTLCRSIHYCRACRQSFEHFKPL
jgi:ring-1,2-phenylacetyl-CoA epoxidase subunit PaaD